MAEIGLQEGIGTAYYFDQLSNVKIIINQPTYLPWLGYFDLIDQADLFVVLDNVQFVKQSWQQRNRIKTAGGLQWLTVPVFFRGRLGQLIKDVEIRDAGFCRNHNRAVELAYRRAPYFQAFFPEFSKLLEQLSSGPLLDLNLGLINWAIRVLGLATPVICASSLGLQGKRTELLAAICESVDADTYLSPAGSACYLLPEQNILTDGGIEVFFHNYCHPEYKQVFSPFEPYASVIDLIFNHGPDSLRILREGRREAYSVEEMVAIQNADIGVHGNESVSTALTL